MVFDFKTLNLREARQKRIAKTAPSAWNAIFDCGHRHILSDEQIHSPAEKRYGGDMYYCSKCAEGDRTGTGDYGFCVKSVYHPIIGATPLFGSSYKQKEPPQQQEVKQNE